MNQSEPQTNPIYPEPYKQQTYPQKLNSRYCDNCDNNARNPNHYPDQCYYKKNNKYNRGRARDNIRNGIFDANGNRITGYKPRGNKSRTKSRGNYRGGNKGRYITYTDRYNYDDRYNYNNILLMEKRDDIYISRYNMHNIHNTQNRYNQYNHYNNNNNTPTTQEKKEEKKDNSGKDKLVNLGMGDCQLIYNLLSDDITNTDPAFYVLKNEVEWHKMRHKGGLVPRLVANQGIIYQSNNNMQFEPTYRHPATQQPKLVQFTPFVDKIRKICEKYAGHILNHALIQCYRNGRDYISDHSDKTIDVARNSKIINFSVGATRLMVLKKKKETEYDSSMNYIKQNQAIKLVNNSLFIMGLKTNQCMYHKIKRDRRDNFVKRSDELLCGGQRISITFRKICTFKSITQPKNILIGQGAKFANRYCIMSVLHNEKKIVFDKNMVNLKDIAIDNDKEHSKEFKYLIHAFGAQNKRGVSFDWERHYGQGFNVVV